MAGNPTAGSGCAPEGVNLRKAFWKTAIPSLLYLALALACLVRWDAPRPWSRLDVFSGAYLLLRLLGSIHSIVSNREVFGSEETRREWWALTSDPGGIKWVMVLMAADLTVFLDYAHWRLTPALDRASLKSLGLALYLLASIWQMWTDGYLARYFARLQPAEGPERGAEGPLEAGPGPRRPRPVEPAKPIREGPFRYIRHPRYAAAIAAKIAFALVFASALGWALTAAWALLLTRKVGIEEAHLRRVFGAEYEEYARRTARMLPGIY